VALYKMQGTKLQMVANICIILYLYCSEINKEGDKKTQKSGRCSWWNFHTSESYLDWDV